MCRKVRINFQLSKQNPCIFFTPWSNSKWVLNAKYTTTTTMPTHKRKLNNCSSLASHGYKSENVSEKLLLKNVHLQLRAHFKWLCVRYGEKPTHFNLLLFKNVQFYGRHSRAILLYHFSFHKWSSRFNLSSVRKWMGIWFLSLR